MAGWWPASKRLAVDGELIGTAMVAGRRLVQDVWMGVDEVTMRDDER
jgi:hypothetical protein